MAKGSTYAVAKAIRRVAIIAQYSPSSEDVIRIEVVELPTEDEPNSGLYRWSFRSDRLYMDLRCLRKELAQYIKPPKFTSQFPVDRVLDQLQNFRKCFVNLTTGEILG